MGELSLVLFGTFFVSPAKQKRDICTAFPAASLSSSLSSSSLSLAAAA